MIPCDDGIFLSIDRARAGLNYSEFAVVEDMGGFSTTQSVKAIVTELSSRYYFGCVIVGSVPGSVLGWLGRLVGY